MIVTKERQRKFRTPLVVHSSGVLVDSLTHGVAGWHFVLQTEGGLESYFSENGRAYSNAVVCSENLVIVQQRLTAKSSVCYADFGKNTLCAWTFCPSILRTLSSSLDLIAPMT